MIKSLKKQVWDRVWRQVFHQGLGKAKVPSGSYQLQVFVLVENKVLDQVRDQVDGHVASMVYRVVFNKVYNQGS